MSYCAYDPADDKFLGDIASIGGWRDFTDWVLETAGRDSSGKLDELENFVKTGASEEPEKLVEALKVYTPDDPGVDDVRQQLIEAAEAADNAVALSDGTADAL